MGPFLQAPGEAREASSNPASLLALCVNRSGTGGNAGGRLACFAPVFCPLPGCSGLTQRCAPLPPVASSNLDAGRRQAGGQALPGAAYSSLTTGSECLRTVPGGRSAYTTVQLPLLMGKAEGLLSLPLQELLKPELVLPPGAIVPLYERLVAGTVLPDCVWLAFQIRVIVSPSGNVHCKVHPLMVLRPVCVSITLAPNPPGHCLLIA